MIIQIFYVFGSLSGALFINRGRRKLLLWSFAISALPLLGLAIIAHPPMWLVLVLFCVFGIAMYSGQCLEAIYPSELFPTGVRATPNGFAMGASRMLTESSAVSQPSTVRTVKSAVAADGAAGAAR